MNDATVTHLKEAVEVKRKKTVCTDKKEEKPLRQYYPELT